MAGLLDEPYIGYPQLARRSQSLLGGTPRGLLNTSPQISADTLRKLGEQLINIPTSATRAITDPQLFARLLGITPNQQLSGFSAGYAGLPAKPPSDIGVVDPRNIDYSKGYSSGEEMGMMTALAAPLAPLARPVGRALGEQAYLQTEGLLQSQGLMPSIVPRSQVPMQTTNVGSQYAGAMPHYAQQENLANVFENAGLKVKESGSTHSNSKYVEIEDPVSGEVITARFANHPQSGHAISLHGYADIEIGDIFKYKSWNEAVDPILERINKQRKEFGDELLTIKQVERLLD